MYLMQECCCIPWSSHQQACIWRGLAPAATNSTFGPRAACCSAVSPSIRLPHAAV